MANGDFAASAETSAKPGTAGLLKRLGLWLNPHPDAPVADELDPSTRLAMERTSLALDRSYLAYERTLQAWIRTALSMISFGFTLGKLGTVVQSIEMKGPFSREYGLKGIAYFLVMLGTLGLTGAIVQHVLQLRGLYRMGFHRRLSIALAIAFLLAILGGFAFTSLVFEL
jgi:putative membrane protein